MLKTNYYTYFLLLLSVLYSCNGGNSTNTKFNDFQKIELLKFNKQKVKFKTKFNFINENDKDITIVNSDFDIFINGIDVDSHINNDAVVLKSKKSILIPIIAEFKPSKVFSDYESGISKIKTDIIADVEIKGIIKIKIDDQEKELEYNNKQTVLFTNNKGIELNDKNEITPIKK